MTDPTPHLSRQRARWELVLFAALGVVLMILGQFWVLTGSPPAVIWLVLLAILGPVMVYAAIIALFAYMEDRDEVRGASPPERRHGGHLG